MALGTAEKYWGGSVAADEDGRLIVVSEGDEVGPLAPTEKYWAGSHATDEYGRLVVVGPGGEPLTGGASVKTYGAKGNGEADDATAIQKAINVVSIAGGGEVFVPVGTYLVGSALELKSKVQLRGAGPEATVIKLKNSANTDVLTNTGYGSTGADNLSIRDLSVDGNKANNASGGTGIKLDGRRLYLSNFFVYNCKTDGLNVQQTASDLSAAEGGSDSMVDSFHIWGCTNYGLFNNIHDAHFTNGFCVGNAATNFYVGSSGSASVVYGVHSWGASTYGFRFDASYDVMNCEAEGASSAQVFINADGGRWIGGRAFVATSPANVPAFEWNTSKGFNTTILGVFMKGCGTAGGLKFTGSGSGSTVSGFYEESGANPLYAGTPGGSVDLSRLRRLGNATLPARPVTSASTMAVTCEAVIEVTGTTEVKKITVPANYPPIVTLKFASTVKVVDGENLKLKETFEATADDTLTLACDGTNYYEIGRSAN
jgi:Pectate lyase superfamily protein